MLPYKASVLCITGLSWTKPPCSIGRVLLNVFGKAPSIAFIISVGIVIITGPLLMWFLESDVGLITESVYGQLIMLKIAIASVMVALGGFMAALGRFMVALGGFMVILGGFMVSIGSNLFADALHDGLTSWVKFK